MSRTNQDNDNQSFSEADGRIRDMTEQLFDTMLSIMRESLFNPARWRNSLGGGSANSGGGVIDTRTILRGILPTLAGIIPIPGISQLFSAILGMAKFADGGIVRGSRFGLPAIVGERNTDELILPLSRLESLLNLPSLTAGRSETTQVIVNMSGSLVDTQHLQDQVYAAASNGHRNKISRRISHNANLTERGVV